MKPEIEVMFTVELQHAAYAFSQNPDETTFRELIRLVDAHRRTSGELAGVEAMAFCGAALGSVFGPPLRKLMAQTEQRPKAEIKSRTKTPKRP